MADILQIYNISTDGLCGPCNNYKVCPTNHCCTSNGDCVQKDTKDASNKCHMKVFGVNTGDWLGNYDGTLSKNDNINNQQDSDTESSESESNNSGNKDNIDKEDNNKNKEIDNINTNKYTDIKTKIEIPDILQDANNIIYNKDYIYIILFVIIMLLIYYEKNIFNIIYKCNIYHIVCIIVILILL